MTYLVANIVQGFGPLLRLGEFVQELNGLRRSQGKKPCGFVIPSPSAKLESILREEFGEGNLLDDIYVDSPYGVILDSAVFKGNDHRDFIKALNSSYTQTQDKINRHFGESFKVTSFKDKSAEIDVNPSECIGFARNPLVRLPFNKTVSYGFGNRSDFWKKMQGLGVEGYNSDYVNSAIRLLEEGAESSRDIEFIQDPATVQPSKPGLIKTPLHSLKRQTKLENIEPGIYVSVTGIPGLRESLLSMARDWDYKIYCPASASKDFPEATAQSPDIVTSPHIKAVFSRFGWGAINLAIMSGKPLVTIPSGVAEDPEIILNQRILVDELEVASVLDGRPLSMVLDEATTRSENTKKLTERLRREYSTIEGPKYAAKHLDNSGLI